MSRPDSHRSLFVGAAWFAALLSLCVVALDPGLIERTRPRAATEEPHRPRQRRSDVVNRPEIAPHRAAPATPAVEYDESGVRSRLTGKPVPADRPLLDQVVRTPQAQSGPMLPALDAADHAAAQKLPAPLRGLETATALAVDVIGPVSAIEGEPAPFSIRVHNPTSNSAEGVILVVSFDECWESPGSDDLSVEHRLGTVPAGETREVTIALRPLQAGALTADFKLASATHSEWSGAAQAEVDPRLVDFAIAGPRRRSAGQRAEFVLTLRNSSDRDLADARVDVEFDAAALAVLEASSGCVSGSGTLGWPLGTLYRGERVQIQIEFDCLTETLRTAIGTAFSAGDRVLRASGAALEIVPSTPLDVVIVDPDDPWTTGNPARFLIAVSNPGPTAISDLQLRISASPHFEQLTTAVVGESAGADVSGDAFGALIRVSSLPPGARLELVATATCALPGDGALRVVAQSPALAAPFEVEESAVVNAPLPE